jgi:23S rRNA pseudouridine1911/1915/1917 synthase
MVMKTIQINKTFLMPHSSAKIRLDQAMAKLLPDFSRMQIKTWIEKGYLTVNEKCVQPKYKTQGGESIHLAVTLEDHADWQAEAIPLTIVYEDEALLIVNKPAGMVVHPAPGNLKHTLVNALLHYHPGLSLLPRAGILHRLDKDTSGLLIVAKTQAALRSLSQQLKKRLITREYLAIVQGKLISGGTINAPIARHPLLRKQMTVSDVGKPAITHYRIQEKYSTHTLVRIQLETGRTHQIRVHFAHKHHPVLGDPVYGKRLLLTKQLPEKLRIAIQQFPRQALHATLLSFTHPITKAPLQIGIDLPEDMQSLIQLFLKS